MFQSITYFRKCASRRAQHRPMERALQTYEAVLDSEFLAE